MQYITTFERAGIQKGEGAMLLRQLEHKFKHLPEDYREQINNADSETLLVWGERILESQSIEEVFNA